MFLFFRPVRTQRKGILKIRQVCFKGSPPGPPPPDRGHSHHVAATLPGPRTVASARIRGCQARGKAGVWRVLQKSGTGQGRADLQRNILSWKVPYTVPSSVSSLLVLLALSVTERVQPHPKQKRFPVQGFRSKPSSTNS